MRAYYYEVWKIGIADFKAHWTAHKIISTVPGSMIGFLISSIFRKPTSGGGFMQAIIASAIGFLAILGLTAIVSAIKAPKLLDDARRSKIGNLNDENQAFRSKPKRTSVEEHHYTVAKAALDDLGPDGTIVLRHLEKHGTLKFNGLDPPVPKGMNARDTKAILDICVSEDLATREAVSKSSGGTYAVVEHTYRIAPGMKTALDELLYSPSRANGQ